MLKFLDFEVGLVKGTVPIDFRTDLNSGHFLPEFWHHRSRHAAVVHDYLYREGTCTREEADKAFHRILIHRGAPRHRARIMYWAVRASGWRSWKRYR